MDIASTWSNRADMITLYYKEKEEPRIGWQQVQCYQPCVTCRITFSVCFKDPLQHHQAGGNADDGP